MAKEGQEHNVKICLKGIMYRLSGSRSGLHLMQSFSDLFVLLLESSFGVV